MITILLHLTQLDADWEAAPMDAAGLVSVLEVVWKTWVFVFVFRGL